MQVVTLHVGFKISQGNLLTACTKSPTNMSKELTEQIVPNDSDVTSKQWQPLIELLSNKIAAVVQGMCQYATAAPAIHTLILPIPGPLDYGTARAYLIPYMITINQSKRKTSNANGQTNLGHKHKAPDHNHEATQPMVDLPHTS